MQTQTSNTLHNDIMEAGSKDRPPMLAPGDYNNVSQDIRDQLNVEAEAVQIILTGIDNDIYSTVDACPNACEMWKAIEMLKQGESINVQDLENKLYWEFGKFTSQDGESLESYYSRFVTLVKQYQELKTVSYHKLYDILKQHQHEVNEIRAERIARVANPLALVAQQQPVYHPQTHPTHHTQNSSTISQQAATRNRGKAIVNSPQPIYDQEPSMVVEDDETSKDKKIDKLVLRTSSNTSRANQDNSPRINKSAEYKNQRIGNVAGVRETVGLTMRAKDAAYHREKMLLCKQEEVGIQLNAEQADWRDDTDDELENQELEAHYMYMAKLQEVSPDAADSGPIFDDEPLQKVSHDDQYNVFAMESKHPEQSESVHDTYNIKQNAHNMIIDSLDMSYDREEIDQNDDDNDIANKHKELDKVIALENKVKVLDNIVYKTGQSVQTMNMLNNKCRTSFTKPEFLKKAQRANPRLRINAGLEQFHRCLNEEMVADLRYFNSLELEVDSLRSQLETQKTQFLNEIDRLSREYYYVDHMNAILEDMNYDSEQIEQNDEDVDLAKERELLASLISKLKSEIGESKNRNTFLETSNKVLVEKLKSEIADFKNKNKSLTEANNKLSEICQESRLKGDLIVEVQRLHGSIVSMKSVAKLNMLQVHEFVRMLDELGLGNGILLLSHFRITGESLDEGLVPLLGDEDVLTLLKYVPKFREIEVYVESFVSLVEQHIREISTFKGKGVVIEEIVEDSILDKQHMREIRNFKEKGVVIEEIVEDVGIVEDRNVCTPLVAYGTEKLIEKLKLSQDALELPNGMEDDLSTWVEDDDDTISDTKDDIQELFLELEQAYEDVVEQVANLVMCEEAEDEDVVKQVGEREGVAGLSEVVNNELVRENELVNHMAAGNETNDVSCGYALIGSERKRRRLNEKDVGREEILNDVRVFLYLDCVVFLCLGMIVRRGKQDDVMIISIDDSQNDAFSVTGTEDDDAEDDDNEDDDEDYEVASMTLV
uniref:Gag-Pol polyprotein n=2 Tax=Tanacetum cinerariifolium TaxID=118510 RepID=A0A6L2KM50_TANCI|nr:Gag-Pol polyprotein [Tanacetum cinerariifolium]